MWFILNHNFISTNNLSTDVEKKPLCWYDINQYSLFYVGDTFLSFLDVAIMLALKNIRRDFRLSKVF